MIEFEDGETLYEKQINTIKEVFPKAHIYYITGFYADKIDDSLKKMGCKVINNFNFHQTNVAYSIGLALEKIKDDSLVIYGDLLFNDELLTYLPKNHPNSFLVKDISDNFAYSEVGLGENRVLNYVFKQKWSQICFLQGKDVEKFTNQAFLPKNYKKFGFEIINNLTETGSKFDVYGASGYVMEIDRLRDMNRINEKLFRKR